MGVLVGPGREGGREGRQGGREGRQGGTPRERTRRREGGEQGKEGEGDGGWGERGKKSSFGTSGKAEMGTVAELRPNMELIICVSKDLTYIRVQSPFKLVSQVSQVIRHVEERPSPLKLPFFHNQLKTAHNMGSFAWARTRRS
jgi:hypothetical protein